VNDPQQITSRQRLLSEDLIALSALASRIKSHRRQGGSVTAVAVWRWASHGLSRPDGTKVKLEVVKFAGRFLTSWPAYLRFVEAQQDAAEPASLPTPARSPSKRQRAAEVADEVLNLAGI
jgi:hypothetical protein